MKALGFLLVAPLVFIACMVQAILVALLYCFVALPFGTARIFTVGYKERD